MTKELNPDGYDLTDAEGAAEFLSMTDDLALLIERTKLIPAGVITPEYAVQIMDWQLYVYTNPIEALKAYAPMLCADLNWEAVVASSLETFLQSGIEGGFAGVMNFYERIMQASPNYQTNGAFVAGTIRALSDAGQLDSLEAALGCVGLRFPAAFGLEVHWQHCDLNESQLHETAILILQYAYYNDIGRDELRQQIAPFWWQQLEDYAYNRSGFLQMGRDGLGYPDDKYHNTARAVVKYILDEEV